MDDECPSDPVGRFFWIIETPFRKLAKRHVDSMFRGWDRKITAKIVEEINAREPPIVFPEKTVKIVARSRFGEPLLVVCVHEYESGELARDGMKECLEQIRSASGRLCEFEYVKYSELDSGAYGDFCQVMARPAPGRPRPRFWRRKPAKA